MPENGGQTKLSLPAIVIAIVVVVTWLLMLVWSLQQRSAQETEWSRILFVLGQIQSVAVAAAGVLFGKEISKQQTADAKEQANKADARARDAEKKAEENKTDAANGKALSTSVKGLIGKQQERATGGTDRMSAARPSNTESTEDTLLRLANSLFPD